MKEKYIKPKADVDIFTAMAVVTTSLATEPTAPGGNGSDGPIELPDFPVNR